MKNTSQTKDTRSGSTLIVVAGLTLLGSLAAGSILAGALARMRQADSQICTEQAFYIAAAGAERAAALIAAGDEASTSRAGTLGNGSYAVDIVVQNIGDTDREFDITSVGTVKNASRTVALHGIRRVSWARFALWYDAEVSKLWIVPGERFDGRVYSKPQFHFHDANLASKGQVRFTDKVSTGASSFEKASSKVAPIFEKGITYNADVESISTINFSDLQSTATSGGLLLNGTTTIILSGTTMKITNSRAGLSNTSVAVPANGLVYVKTTTGGTSSTRPGNLTISAPSGFKGQLTLVADNDILVADHVRYANNPTNHPNSTDALGLIAKRNVSVQTTASKNLDLYAHIICQSGGFGVIDYDEGSSRGNLNVYGGIVNSMRMAVGTVGGSGYSKNYVFDRRFTQAPPPHYPKVTDELEWTEWDG